MRVVTFMLSEHELEELDKYAMKHGLTRSTVIREAIRAYIHGRAPGPQHRFRVRKVALT